MKKWVQQARKKWPGWWQGQRKRMVEMSMLGVTMVVLPLMVGGGFWVYYRTKIFPGVRVAGFDVGGYSKEQAWRTLDVLERDYLAGEKLVVEIEAENVATKGGVIKREVDFYDVDLSYDPIATTEEAFGHGRGGEWWSNLGTIVQGLGGVEKSHACMVDEKIVAERVAEMAAEVDTPGAMAEVRLVEVEDEKRVEVYGGENGLVIDQEKVVEKIGRALAGLEPKVSGVKPRSEDNVVSEEEISRARERAEKFVDQEMVVELALEGESQAWTLTDEEMLVFMGFEGGFDETKLKTYVEMLVEGVEREPQNATFKYENGRVIEFAPGLPGVKVNVSQTIKRLENGLELVEAGDDKARVELAVRQLPPERETPDVNDLGINELLGRGISTYRGSIAGRVHNVALTASRLDGVLIPPGETFSFNKTIGDVSRVTGYKTAYIIKDGRTILGDGGGVCQDSTTLFRAILDAGLPIVERKAHAYRVGYYEQNSEPGFDATVYAPSPDLKFMNDTPAHILIQAKADVDKVTLVIDLYGTSDGRKASIVNYQKWGAVPAPPPLYQDDPTLAPGEVRQVDWASPGLRVKFDYVVERDGETVFEKTFYSNFRPWQAVYLRGV